VHSKAGSLASLVSTARPPPKKKLTKNEKPLSRVSPVQYSPRRQSRWVLADYGGQDLWNRWVLSLEWNSECVMEGGWEWWAGARWIRECDNISRVFCARLAERDRKLIPEMRWCIVKWEWYVCIHFAIFFRLIFTAVPSI